MVGGSQIWLHRQAHQLACHLPGDRGAVRAELVGVCRLFVGGHRVVGRRWGDIGGLEPGLGLEGVVILDAQGVLGEDAGAVGLRPGEDLEGLVQSREGAKGLLMRGVFLAAWREFLPGRPAGRGGGDRGLGVTGASPRQRRRAPCQAVAR